MTQIEYAKSRNATPELKRAAADESIAPAALRKALINGTAVIPANNRRRLKMPCAIGRGLATKVNANIGTSTDKHSVHVELEKLRVCIEAGAHTVMDLSVGGDLAAIRARILRLSAVPVGTVPIYEVAANAERKRKNFLRFTTADIFSVLEEQASQGVDFFTIHAGVTQASLEQLRKHRRLMGIVSRGGAILARWMKENNRENPLFEDFDRVLDIAQRYDVTLSLGDGLRPGSILDATDQAQLKELKILGELALRCRKRNVQVMIEGPGHVPMHQIKENIELEKKYCHGAPFYVLGPLVTDVAPGYDHITSAIGGAMAAWYGADFLCYVTASEHLRLPSIEDVREGVVCARIAAHAADIAKGLPNATDWDRMISLARSKRDWKKQLVLSLDPQKARHYRLASRPKDADVCTMCGKFCSIKTMEKCL